MIADKWLHHKILCVCVITDCGTATENRVLVWSQTSGLATKHEPCVSAHLCVRYKRVCSAWSQIGGSATKERILRGCRQATQWTVFDVIADYMTL